MAEPAERRKTYLKRKKNGLCPRCGNKIKKTSKFKYCDDCREYFREYIRASSDSVQETRRTRYAQRKAKNQCPRCGTPVGKKSKTTLCSACLDKQYRYNTGSKRPKKR
ncbi:MAG: hypothetical protein FWC03_09590 [Treponema sp.]|nr:hypothetical protein [Treponema sp.]